MSTALSGCVGVSFPSRSGSNPPVAAGWCLRWPGCITPWWARRSRCSPNSSSLKAEITVYPHLCSEPERTLHNPGADNAEALPAQPEAYEARFIRCGESRCPVLRGAGGQLWYGCYTVAPLGNQTETENTNFILRPRELPAYSKSSHQGADSTQSEPQSLPRAANASVNGEVVGQSRFLCSSWVCGQSDGSQPWP